MTDERSIVASAMVAGNIYDAAITIRCSSEGMPTYTLRTFDKSGEVAPMLQEAVVTQYGMVPTVRFQVRVDAKKAINLANDNPVQANQVHFSPGFHTDQATAREILGGERMLVKLGFQNGPEIFRIDQRADPVRTVLAPCLSQQSQLVQEQLELRAEAEIEREEQADKLDELVNRSAADHGSYNMLGM